MRSITARPLAFLIVVLALLALASAACGGGQEGPGDGLVLTPVQADILPVVVSSDLAVGQNRFVVGLINQKENAEVIGAQVHFRFFKLDGSQATLKFETEAKSVQITKSYTHTHQDGTTETHEAGETGAYVANVTFDSAGQWGVEVSGAAGGKPLEPVRPIFDVREHGQTAAVGQPAPRSVQPIRKDVSDITDIDTSDPPNPEMHNMTIADAVASGRPTVIVFATPAFCTSRVCGPTKEVVDELWRKYKGRANFVHVEPYDLEKARSGQGLEVLPFLTEQWGLQSEPWVFLVDSEGLIAAKFEGVVTYEELEAAFLPLLGAAGGS